MTPVGATGFNRLAIRYANTAESFALVLGRSGPRGLLFYFVLVSLALLQQLRLMSQADLRALPKKTRREAGCPRLLQSIALFVDPDWILDQGCCGSLPLLKVSSGCQVL